MEFLDEIRAQISSALEELYAAARVEKDAVLVVGCSTSEVIGEKIGSAGSPQIADTLVERISAFCCEKGIWFAAQCCEHLNRAIVVEKEAMKLYGFTRVNAVPQVHAGGSLATSAYAHFKDPVLVSGVVADMGIDIGDTLIGMHIRPVVVPVRASVKRIGQANLVLARSRCPFVGGERAVYNPELN